MQLLLGSGDSDLPDDSDEELAAAKGRIDQLNEEAAELAFLDRLAEQQVPSAGNPI